jgi:YGGT family
MQKENKQMANQPYQPNPQGQNYPQPAPIYSDDTIQSGQVGGAHVQSQRESYVDPAGNRIENREEVFEDKNLQRANIRYWIRNVTYFILGVIEVILALRFIFRLLGANAYSGFIQFLYSLSAIFVGPFNGIFNDQGLGQTQTHVFETSTIIAMLVYALIAWGIVSLGRVMFSPVTNGQQRFTTTRRRQV